jgi:hypothetical protein
VFWPLFRPPSARIVYKTYISSTEVMSVSFKQLATMYMYICIKLCYFIWDVLFFCMVCDIKKYNYTHDAFIICTCVNIYIYSVILYKCSQGYEHVNLLLFMVSLSRAINSTGCTFCYVIQNYLRGQHKWEQCNRHISQEGT